MSQLKFTPRASPVLAEHRTIYKIAQIVLILHFCCRSSQSSLPKLQLFNWSLKTSKREAILLKAAATKSLNINAWGFDPVLTLAVNYAIAEGLVITTSTGYALTDSGSILVNFLIKDNDVLHKEKRVLSAIGKSITESMINEVTKNWIAQ